MKYQSSITKKIYDITSEKKRTLCPECSHNRRKAKELCVNWNHEENIGFCHHCNTTFFKYESKPEKIYAVPEWKNITKLSDKAVKWFNGRGIKQETLNKLKE